MTSFEAIILGIVEGLTEFLPVSSTAHLLFATSFLGIEQSDFSKSFTIAIQSGAMLAVLFLYGKHFFEKRTLTLVFAAFLPTALIGFLAYPFVKGYFFEQFSIIAYALIAGGLLMIFFERWLASRSEETISKETISPVQAFIIGLSQALAVVPGVSRSGASIVAGLALSISRKTIVEFSFLLAVPTIFAATAYDAFKHSDAFFSSDFTLLSLGFLSAFVSALLVIKLFLAFIRKFSFVFFGIYRILAGLLILFFY